MFSALLGDTVTVSCNVLIILRTLILSIKCHGEPTVLRVNEDKDQTVWQPAENCSFMTF